MKEKVLQEITEKRDRYTKHFMLPEKGTAAAVYPETVHYETESGWEEIDNRLESVSISERENGRQASLYCGRTGYGYLSDGKKSQKWITGNIKIPRENDLPG